MPIPTAILLWLTLAAAFERNQKECHSKIFHCPCGRSDATVKIRLNCEDQAYNKDPCTRFENCATCKKRFKFCLTCPFGRTGILCEKEQQCPKLRSPEDGSVRCYYNNVKERCIAKCAPGYSFPNDKKMIHLRCDNTSLRWSPYSSFPPCITQSVPELCRNLSTVANAESLTTKGRFVSEDEEFYHGMTIDYACKSGFTLQGQRSLTCLSSGSWSAEEPRCIRNQRAECGKSIHITKRLVGGNKTTKGEYPWHVGIATPILKGWEIKCGGVLISDSAILTAAHCMDSVARKNIVLYLGKYLRSIQEDEDEDVQVKIASQVIIHPDYGIKAPFDSDIAVIRFHPPVSFSQRIQPICLPNAETTLKNLVPKSKGLVTGWGMTQKKEQSDVLLKIKVPVVSNKICKKTYKKKRMKIQITDNMICAGYKNGHVDSCMGDSGGPLMFASKLNRFYTVEGLVSFGSKKGCGLKEQYSIYTKVSNYVNWIKDNI